MSVPIVAIIAGTVGFTIVVVTTVICSTIENVEKIRKGGTEK